MSPIINEALNELIDAVDKEADQNKYIDMYSLFQNLTMDVIARTSLGIHSKAQIHKKDPLVRLARIIVSNNMGFFTMFTYSFPELVSVFSLARKLLLSFSNEGKHPRAELLERTAAVIKDRKINSHSRRRDMLQLMMDSRIAVATINDNNLTAGENDDAVQNDAIKKENGRKLTDDEVLHNAAVFLLAGYETTSTALAFTLHLLTHHSDVQEKVRNEIRSFLTDGKDVSYEVVSKCQYLDKVLSESLRIYPPITFFVNRMATTDIAVGNIRVPKNVAIQVPVHTLHHDPEFWDKPEEFNPERFSPEEKAKRNVMVYQPFGAGPRNCVGMRFAQMEAKMALAKLLDKYRFKPREGTNKHSLEISNTIVTSRPRRGIIVEVEKL